MSKFSFLQVSEIAVLKLENQKLQKALKTMDALENQVFLHAT